MKNFDKYFKRQYNISNIVIEMSFLKLQGEQNGKANIQGQEGGYVQQSGQSAGNNEAQPRSSEAVNGDVRQIEKVSDGSYVD